MQMYHSIGVFAISDNYSTSASAIDCSFKDSFTAPSHSFWTYISPSCGYSDSELYLLDDRFAALDQRVPGLKRCMETSGSMPIPCSLNGDVHFTEYTLRVPSFSHSIFSQMRLGEYLIEHRCDVDEKEKGGWNG